MKKILGLSVAAMMIMALVGGGTWAYFSDPETSTGNILTAGTMDLKTNTTDGETATLTLTGLKPGQSIGTGTVTLTNGGTVDGSSLDINISYIEDASEPTEPTDSDLSTELDADDFAEMVQVNTLTYDSLDLLLSVTEDGADSNTFKDLKEVAAATLTGQAGITTIESKDFVITLTLHADADNDFMADGVDVTFTFTLQQS